jgi:capsular polysaccharide transport system permease protein
VSHVCWAMRWTPYSNMTHPTAKSGSVTQDIAAFGSDLRRYFKVIMALLRREEEVRRHAPIESFLEVLEPVALLLTVGTLRFFMGTAPLTLGYDTVFFLATGFYPKYMFLWISNYMRIGVLKVGRRYPVEQRLDYIFVHIILRVFDYSIVGIFLFTVIYLVLSHTAYPRDFRPIIMALVAMAMLGFGWGVANMLLMQLVWFWKYVFMILNRTLIIISGALFVPDFMSPSVRYWLSFNPTLHAIALFRTGFFEHYPTILLDRKYLFYCCVVSVVGGLVLERVTRRLEV